MSWLRSGLVQRRHVVAVEDHFYHTAEFLEAVARTAPGLIDCVTLCAIDMPGPDTTQAVAGWLARHPTVQVAARVDPGEVAPGDARRLLPIAASHLEDPSSFARLVASLLLPGGVLVQDIHLSTLTFVSRERWWESIYAAATVRGMLADRPPAVRFLSNKRGYAATFGRELMDAGFDPRDVMDKAELEATVVPAIDRDVRERFPLVLDWISGEGRSAAPVPDDDLSRREIAGAIDLAVWAAGARVELGGRLAEAPVTFRAGSQEAATWQALVDDRLAGGPGVPVLDVGLRLAEPGAERAEASNLAARHIHGLRARLSSPAAIVTDNHAYRLDERLVVGRVRRRVP